MSAPLPDHYVTAIRRLVRFSVVSIFVGLCLGVWSTDANKRLRYLEVTGAPRRLSAEDRAAEGSRVEMELPPGLMWEVGIDLRLSHGHVILIGGVLPLCLAAALAVVHLMGGATIGRGTLEAFYWLYLVGGLAAMGLIIYKGWFLMAYVGVEEAGGFDLARIHGAMFGGSRALKGAAYGLSHTILAAAVGIIAVALWRAVGRRRAAP
ncbi:MAG: hypothetical protein KIT58_20745 [Planctomycetota bacterium]|nr:hypothetical protein [Planctomycetota bacterium]